MMCEETTHETEKIWLEFCYEIMKMWRGFCSVSEPVELAIIFSQGPVFSAGAGSG